MIPPSPTRDPRPAEPASPPTPATQRVFVGGCERSGTTFLGAEISKWTGLTFLPESYFLLEILKRHEARPSLELRGLILDHWRFRAWNLRSTELRDLLDPATGAQDCMDLLAQRYTQSLGAAGFQGWIEHTPYNTSSIHLLDRHFDDARYINVIRDGRAVAASILRTDFGPTTVRGAAMWWQAHVLPGLAASYADSERVLLVRYEDLLLRPDWSRDRVLEFLGHRRQNTGHVPVRVDPLFRDTHRLVGKPGDRSRVDAWKKNLSPRQIESFEAIAGGSLQNLGYELSFERAAEPRRALWYLDQLVDSARQLCWQLPRRVLSRRKADTLRPAPSATPTNTTRHEEAR